MNKQHSKGNDLIEKEKLIDTLEDKCSKYEKSLEELTDILSDEQSYTDFIPFDEIIKQYDTRDWNGSNLNAITVMNEKYNYEVFIKKLAIMTKFFENSNIEREELEEDDYVNVLKKFLSYVENKFSLTTSVKKTDDDDFEFVEI